MADQRPTVDLTAAHDLVGRVAVALGGAVVAEVLRGRRYKPAIRVRHVSALIMRRLGMSYPKIGRALGGLCHGTAMNACERAAELERAEPAVAALIAQEMQRQAQRRRRQQPPPKCPHCGGLVPARAEQPGERDGIYVRVTADLEGAAPQDAEGRELEAQAYGLIFGNEVDHG